MRATRYLVVSFGALAAAVATPLDARGSCEKQPAAASGAPRYSPDTAAAFSAEKRFASIAAAADVPNGYYKAYSGLNAATLANTVDFDFLGVTTLQTYDSCACAQRCNAIQGCVAVNIFFQRDPSLNPGSKCPNPASATQIKCAFFGGLVDKSNALNYGQWREKFQVVIAGSNGYVNTLGAIALAKKDIAKNSLQPYCSSVLGYTIPTVKATTTVTTTPTVKRTSTTAITVTANTKITFVNTAIATSLVTNPITVVTTSTITQTVVATQIPRRDVATPAALTKYPGAIVSTACGQVVSRPTSTATSTIRTTVTAAPVTSVIPVTSVGTATTTQTIFTTLSVTTIATTSRTTTLINFDAVVVVASSTTTSVQNTPTTAATTTSAQTTSTVAATTTTVQAPTTTIISDPAPTCAAGRSYSEGSAADGCGCSYTTSCGKFVKNDTCREVSVESFNQCSRQCDIDLRCSAFIFQEDAGACTICTQPPTLRGDGTVGFITGARTPDSCRNPLLCSNPSTQAPPATIATTISSQTTPTTLATTTSVQATTTTVAAAPAPTCAAPQSVSFFNSQATLCGCSYASSCGKSTADFDAAACYSAPVGTNTFEKCATSCDQDDTCTSFVLDEGAGTCRLCSYQSQADGTAGFTMGYRTFLCRQYYCNF